MQQEGFLFTGREIVRTEWCDYNNHMNMAYYVVVFDGATDAYKDHVGIDRNYRKDRNHTTFAAELHVVYLQELHAGEEVELATCLLDWDAKRHHFIHGMYRASDGQLCATMEVMSLHIDLATRRTAPWPADIAKRIEALAEAHVRFPRPEEAGRIAGLRKGRRDAVG